MSNSLTAATYISSAASLENAVGETWDSSLNRRLGMQEWNMLLPIGLNNTAKFTGTWLTSAFRNARGGGTEWAEWTNDNGSTTIRGIK